MEGEGMEKLRNPDARATAAPERQRVNRVTGAIATNHHIEGRTSLSRFRARMALQAA
jgi:hypothetical protein